MLRRPLAWAACPLILAATLAAPVLAAPGLQQKAAPVTKAAAPVAKVPGEEVRGPGSYALGYGSGRNLREQLREQNVDIDRDQLVEGFAAASKGANPKLTEAAMQQALLGLQERQVALNKAAADRQTAANAAFLATNGKNPGVLTTKSGLQYTVLRPGKGKSPGPKSVVVVHYEGKLLDGKVFDSSYKRQMPQELRVDGVIPGWQEALPLMKKGEKRRLWIPPALGYGERGVVNLIPPNATLTFDVELVDIKDEPKAGPTHEEGKDTITNPKPGEF